MTVHERKVLRFSLPILPSELAGDGVLVLAVAGSGHDGGRGVHVEEEVHSVEEALEVTILEIVAD